MMLYKGINLSKLTDDEVLFFVRIHGKKGIFGTYYPNVVLDQFESVKNYKTISEYKVGDVFIKLDKNNLKEITDEDFKLFREVLDIEDIIVRCRALRKISYEESRQLIWLTAKFFLDFFKKNKELKVIVSLIVDNYVMDVMERISRHMGIEMMQMIGFFVPGYIRLTDRFGVGIPVRDIENEEVDNIYNRLTKKEKSHFAISKKRGIKNALRDYISYRYRYLFRYLMSYKLRGNLDYESRFAKYFKGFHSLSKIFVSHFFDDMKGIKESPSDLIFIPLHYHPEATVDYWTDSKEHADYINSLLEIVAICKGKKLKVIFKEHPNYYLKREPNFYKILKSFDNVYLLKPYISSQEMFEKVDNICIHTGSAGFEALMLDKKVYTVSENYYTFNKIPCLKEFKRDTYPYFSKKEKKELIRKVLKTTLKK